MTTHPGVRLLEQAVARDPDRVAVRTPSSTWRARDLLDEVTAFRGLLTRSGAVAGDAVLVVGSRAPAFPVVLLAAWSAGLVPVLADEQHPDRLAALADEAAAPWVVEVATSTVAARSAGPRVVDPDASHVLFTSGTTGRPVGVVVGPEPIEAAIGWYVDEFAPGPDDRVALLSGLAHDPVLRDVLVPLAAGCELVVPPADALRDPRTLRRVLQDVTILHATPSLVEFALGHDAGSPALPDLRLVLLGGEAPTATSVALLRAASSARLVNVYGATETPQVVAAWDIGDEVDVAGLSVVGRGVAGARLVLGAETPGWFREQTGCADDEIVVRGRHLARGYLHRPAPSRFVPDPLGAEGWTAYLTRDRGAVRPDGALAVTGRIGRELNLHGHRLHPVEVESAARQVDGVAAARCTLEDGDLGAVLVLRVGLEPGSDLRAKDIRSALRGVLPSWAVPSRIDLVGSGALTANHKRVV